MTAPGSLHRTIDQIEELFQQEFSFVAHKFDVIPIRNKAWETSKDPRVARGGVYVWWNRETTWKVGKSMSNTRKRALQHREDNTGDRLKAIINGEGTVLLLFNILEDANQHWILALENYLERTLNPKVQSKRKS